MAGSALISGLTVSPFTKRMLKTASEYFDHYDIVAYLLGRKTQDMTRFLRKIDIDEVIWDHDLDKSRPKVGDADYLRTVEERHGAGLVWKAISSDRKLYRDGLAQIFNNYSTQYNEEELLGHVEARLRPLERLFEKRSFLYVFSQQLNHLGGYLCARFADAFDVPFFRVGHTRIGDRYTLHNNEFEYSDTLWTEVDIAKKLGDDYPTASEAKALIRKVKNGSKLYTTPTPNINENYQRSSMEQAKYVLNLILAEKGGVTTDYYAETPKIKLFSKIAKKHLNKWHLEKMRTFDDLRTGSRSVYFPLQVQPELSLMIWAPYYKELEHTAKKLAESLPADSHLNINEHPNHWGVRSYNYYRRLMNVPNIHVLNRNIPTSNVIEASDAVVTVTATVGLEALVKNTPVLTFGEERKAPTYANLDTVRTIEFNGDLPIALADAMDDEVDHSEVQAYVAASLSHGIPRDHPNFAKEVCNHIDNYINKG